MRSVEFEWDDRNLDHIALHSVEPDEAEAVLDNNPLVLRTADGKYLGYGQTDGGRYLLVVFIRKSMAVVRVITARDLTDGERRCNFVGGGGKMAEIPSFADEEAAAAWFATHDTGPYMAGLEEVTEPMPVVRSAARKKPVGLRIRADYLDALKQVAARKGIPYQTLIQMWLVEKLRQEAPDLLDR
jgi:uncharacterized DUF497 family protein